MADASVSRPEVVRLSLDRFSSWPEATYDRMSAVVIDAMRRPPKGGLQVLFNAPLDVVE